MSAARLAANARVAAADQRTEAAGVQAAEAVAALSTAHDRLADRQALIEQLQGQIGELTSSRDALSERVRALETDAATLRGRLDEAARDAVASREAQVQHVRAIEDRASREIDRARQETREQARAHAAADRERQQRQTTLEGALAEARHIAAQASRDLAAEQARREVLEVQLAELHDRMAVALSAKTPYKRITAPEKKPARRPRSNEK